MDHKMELLKQSGTFSHFISLGHCCRVATELKNLGLRDASMPFDWIRTTWGAIEQALESHFDGFLNYDDLYQSKSIPHAYRNNRYDAVFVHDFVDYRALKPQMKFVQNKYNRRIERFFENIKEPTLFIRYMMKPEELEYISENYQRIEAMIKQYNPANEIVFISHDDPGDVDVSKIKFLFLIEKDDNPDSNLHPLSSCGAFYDFLATADYGNREKNLFFAKNPPPRKVSFGKRLKQKFIKVFLSKRKYTHTKQY